MIYELLPYVAVGPLRFGMTTAEVESVMGTPLRISATSRREPRYRYPEFNAVFALTGGLAEVSFFDTAHVLIEAVDIFETPWPLQHLLKLDPGPLEDVGFLLLPKLGIMCTGFHNYDDRTLTALASASRLDPLLSNFKPYTR